MKGSQVTLTARETLANKTCYEDGHRTTPLLQRFYKSRGSVIHELVKNAAQCIHTANKECQLLILGAGLDESYDRYATATYAVDFPEVINERRRKRINECDNQVRIKSKGEEAILIEGDLSDDPSILLHKLTESGFNPKLPTIILAECVLVYIDSDSVEALLRSLATNVNEAILITYDPIFPRPRASQSTCHDSTPSSTSPNHDDFGFASMIHDKFSERKAPLLSGSSSRESHIASLHAMGWPFSACFSMQQAIRMFLPPRQSTSTDSQLIDSHIIDSNLIKSQNTCDPFDEFSSLALLNRIYCVTLATTSSSWFSSVYTHSLKFPTESNKSHSSNNNQSLDLSLNCRLEAASLRLSVLESKFSSVSILQGRDVRKTISFNTEPTSSVNSHKIRDFEAYDLSSIKELIDACFYDVSCKHQAVRKFLKTSFTKLKGVVDSKDVNDPISSANDLKCGESKSKFWVVENNDNITCKQVVGCVGLRVQQGKDENPTAEVNHLCVHKNFRRNGIAKALMNHIIKFCEDNSIKCIQLSVLEDLEAARQLYSSLGFVLVRRACLGQGCFLHHMVLNF